MSVTAARGFRAAGVSAGLRTGEGHDVAVVVNDGPDRHAAGVLTTNRVEAAPVTWTRQVLTDGRLDAVLLNAGGANACTGPAGFADTHRSAEEVARLLGVSAGDVAVCSTGLIGERLPMDRLLAGAAQAVAALGADGSTAARAIMTTDTVPKEAVVAGDGFVVGGMAKGAGMLAPALATMLAVVTTDAVAPPQVLRTALARACARTFDRVDTDGCRSTNDTVLLLSSGASGVRPDPAALEEALTRCCADLARALVADAEGAAHEIRIEVRTAADEDDAVDVARAVARSSLFKCAIFGNDPNWGRVVAAVGTTDARFDPHLLDVTINGVRVCHRLAPDADRSGVDLRGRQVHVVIDLHAGQESASVWTTDLTHEYVSENSEYST